MYMWTNGEMRDCIDVVVNLGSGTTSYSTTNVSLSVRDDGERSSLLLTHKWNETMIDADQIYANVKEADKDVNYNHNRMTAHRVFLANTFGLSGFVKMMSTAKIPLPLKVRDVNPKITVVKKNSNFSRILVISMESAKEAKQVDLSEIQFGVLMCDKVDEVTEVAGK
jgi:hypothetical protein